VQTIRDNYKKNLKHRYVIAVVPALTLLAPCGASAQSEAGVLAGVRACQNVVDAADRLACYDTLLPPARDAVGRAASPAARAEPVDRAPTPAPRAESVERVSSPTARVESAPPEPAPAQVAAAPARRPPEPESVAVSEQTARIVEVRAIRPGSAVFLAEDGRIFQQTDSNSRLRLPEAPFDAELEEGFLGAKFLKVADDGPRVRVTLRD